MVDYSKFEKITVDSDDDDGAGEKPSSGSKPNPSTTTSSSSAPKSPPPKPSLEGVTKWDEEKLEQLSEELGPLVKALEIERAGGDRAAFMYWLFEALEARTTPEGKVVAKCDLEHKGQFDAAEKHYVRSYLFDPKEKTVQPA
eukprot:RCo000069